MENFRYILKIYRNTINHHNTLAIIKQYILKNEKCIKLNFIKKNHNRKFFSVGTLQKNYTCHNRNNKCLIIIKLLVYLWDKKRISQWKYFTKEIIYHFFIIEI